MKRAVLAVWIACVGTAAYAENDLYRIEFRRIAEGVYVGYRADPLRPYVEGNVTIIINDRDVVVVDANGSPRAARQVIQEIRRLTTNPVRYVIHTHIHRDHRFGVQEYVREFPGVDIVAHPIVRDVIASSGDTFVANTIARMESRRAEQLTEIARLRAEAKPGNDKIIAMLQRFHDDIPTIVEEYRGIRNLPPTMTVGDKLTLYRGARTIEILFLGRGDTDHDLVVYLPREKIVAAGDMVVHPFPYGFSTNPAEWLSTLRKLSTIDFETLVPGHGDVQKGKSYLNTIIELNESVQAQTRAALAAGLTLDRTRERVDLSRFEKLLAGDDPIKRYFFHEYFVKPAVEQAYKQK